MTLQKDVHITAAKDIPIISGSILIKSAVEQFLYSNNKLNWEQREQFQHNTLICHIHTYTQQLQSNVTLHLQCFPSLDESKFNRVEAPDVR